MEPCLGEKINKPAVLGPPETVSGLVQCLKCLLSLRPHPGCGVVHNDRQTSGPFVIGKSATTGDDFVTHTHVDVHMTGWPSRAHDAARTRAKGR
ncbi:hypothetical protein ACVIM8_007108 [Bradyrhizobium sp. USDA 4529]